MTFRRKFIIAILASLLAILIGISLLGDMAKTDLQNYMHNVVAEHIRSTHAVLWYYYYLTHNGQLSKSQAQHAVVSTITRMDHSITGPVVLIEVDSRSILTGRSTNDLGREPMSDLHFTDERVAEIIAIGGEGMWFDDVMDGVPIRRYAVHYPIWNWIIVNSYSNDSLTNEYMRIRANVGWAIGIVWMSALVFIAALIYPSIDGLRKIKLYLKLIGEHQKVDIRLPGMEEFREIKNELHSLQNTMDKMKKEQAALSPYRRQGDRRQGDRRHGDRRHNSS